MSYKSIIDDYIHTPIFEGGRNQALFKAAAACKDEGYTQADTEQALTQKAQGDGLNAREITQCIQSAFARPVSELPRLEGGQIGQNLSWDEDLNGLIHAPKRKIEVYKAEIPPPGSNWLEDYKRLIESAFLENEKINIVKNVYEREGKFIPGGKGENSPL